MLKRLSLRDVVIVAELEIEPGPGFTVLTGETGAGKSILIDALQLALGNRADASLVREGAVRAEVSAEFDTPDSLRGWLEEAGYSRDDEDAGALLLRRSVDSQGKSRAWINGSPATVAQLREIADHLVEIHGQHAWQSLARPAAVRALVDSQAGADTAPLSGAWQRWRRAQAALDTARGERDTLQRERDRLAWQIGEVDKLAPADGEWELLEAEHQRLAHAQSLLEGARDALDAAYEDEAGAHTALGRAVAAIDEVQRYDAQLGEVGDALRAAQSQIEDAAHTLRAYLGHREPDPERLAELDSRIGAWIALARRHRRPPAELPALLAGWRDELRSLDAAADLEALEREEQAAAQAWRVEAERVSKLRKKAAPKLAAAVTQTMQQLGMAGGRFEVALVACDAPQAWGLESAEFRVAGHAGSTPRPLAKVASGGELSRLALAIAVAAALPGAASPSTPGAGAAPTLIFDEIDAGVGGTVAESVGRLLAQLGRGLAGGGGQVLAVTHLAQVAACATGHWVVAKSLQGRQTLSRITAVDGEARVAEIARMLGGETWSGTAHAQALLGSSSAPRPLSGARP